MKEKNMSKKIEQEVSKVILGLADAIEKDEYDDYVKNHKGKINIDLDNFDQWWLHLYESEKPMEQYIKEFFRNKGVTDSNALNRLVFAYQHFHFLERNVNKLVDLGRGCCADKSSFIVKTYIKWLAGGKKPAFPDRNDEKHQYWHPDFGDIDLWYRFVESLESLYYGYAEEYFAVYNQLLSLKKEALDEIEKENEIFRQFIPTYMEIMKKHKDEFSKEAYDKLIHIAHRSTVIHTFFKDVKAGTVTDEIVLKAAKEFEERYSKLNELKIKKG
jgi:hypothetical protein